MVVGKKRKRSPGSTAALSSSLRKTTAPHSYAPYGDHQHRRLEDVKSTTDLPHFLRDSNAVSVLSLCGGQG